MEDESEWRKLSTEDKCQHKVWKARLAGYEEATKLFKSLDEKSQEFSKYAGFMKKFVTDNNAVAQEKGLDAVLSFVENAPTNVCGRTCNDVVTGVITKCLNASKAKTKEKGMEIIMLYIEAEKPDIVQECLMTGMENKQPKVVIGSIQTVTAALRDFGTKVVQVKPLLKLLPKLLQDRDKNVREETKQLVIEIYRWIGAALKPQMTNFQPIQVQELEAEFEKMPNEKPQQSRFMRSQQDLKAKMEEKAAAAAAAGGDEGDGGNDAADDEDAIDPYDLLTPVDLLAQMPKNFYEQIEAKKWQERKEALEAVHKLSENPRLEPGDFSQLIRSLLTVISKDTNVMLVALAGKTLAGIAKGLRKKFQPYASATVSAVLEKFKEKKATVVAALREAIDAAYHSISLEVIQEDTIAALENKNPSIRAETALFLARCFAYCTQASLPKKILKAYVAPLLKTMGDTDPTVREASFEAVGTAMKVVSEKNIAPFLVDVDNLKMPKIQEWCEKAVLLNAKGEPRTGGGSGAPAASRPATAPPPKAGSEPPKPVARPATAKPATGGPSKAKAAKGKPPAKKGGKKAAVEEKVESTLSDEVVDEKAAALLPGDILTNLLSANWKERLAAMESFVKVVSSTSKDDIPCQVCIRTICKKPGLKDTNFQVLKLKLELVAHLTRNSRFSKRSAEFCMVDIVDKVGDVKNGAAAKECLTGMSEAVGLDFVSVEVMSRAFEQKNPKNQQEALSWLTNAIQEFGLKVNVKAMLGAISKGLAASNPGVRTTTISLLGVMYTYMGDQLRVLFDNEKPALLQQIDAEFEKMKDVKPPPPTRKLLSATGDDDKEDDEEEAGGDEQGEAEVQDLVPRNDISEKITDALLAQLTDKNWKVRGEGLQTIVNILAEAKFVKPNLGSLPEALKARLGESNKNLQTTTVNICSTLATALGPHCKVHFKTIAPGLLPCLGDSKPNFREKVVACLNVWMEHSSLLALVENEALYDALKVENPNLRAELLGWLSSKLPSHKQLPVEFRSTIPLVLASLEDRNPDVRKKAQEALVPFMIHTGYDAFLKGLGKCKPSSKDQIMPLLEKARGELPAKPAPQKKAAAKSAPSAAAPKSRPAAAAAAKPEEPEEEPEKPAAPVKSESRAKVVKGKGKPPPTSGKKKEEEDFGPPMTNTVTKEQRIKEEKAMKVLKWNFIELRAEFVEQLKLQMEKNFNKGIMADLFHADFKAHIKAIEQLIKCMETHPKETVNNIDLILKWLTIRFFDTNPSMLNKALDYLQKLFAMLASMDYHLSDLEANSFVPYLLLKSGDPKDNVRRDVRTILKLMCKIYPSSKLFSFIIEGLKCKVSKQRMELLEELGCLIDGFGINVCQPSPAQALKVIAGQISDRDNGVRNAALNTVVVAYTILGESVFKYIGHLNEKEQSYLDERIKRAMKNKEMAKPAAAKEPLQPKVQQQQQQAERPSTAPRGMNKAASQPNIARSAVKKTYQLDIDLDPNDEPKMPDLCEIDLEAFMAPVEKPKVRRAMSPSQHSARLNNSPDVSANIGSVVTQISDVQIFTSIKALAQVDQVLADKNRAGVLVNHVDNLLMMISMQARLGLSQHFPDPEVNNSDVVGLYRCLMSTLFGIFDKTNMGKRASTHVLKDLLNSLLSVLLDSRLEQLPEGPQLIRTANILAVKIINKSDPTNVTCAIITLLRECLQNETCSNKFLSIVIKCLWKILNLVQDILEDLNVDRVLYECHLFFQQYPASSVRRRPNLDMPVRTIKTLLHNLTKLKGHKILSHTGLIGPSENSEVEAYLHSVLAKSSARSDGDTGEKAQSASKNRRMSKPHEQLSEIFKKIGKEKTREGLNDLYDFKQKYPEADIEPFLKKTSPHFQKYINNMLADIEAERHGKKSRGDLGGPLDFSSNKSGTAGETEDPDVDFYREKLQKLRAMCGLDKGAEPMKAFGDSQGTDSTSKDTPETPEDEQGNVELQWHSSASRPVEEPSKQAVDVSSLKARLERIKKMANS
ncbi:cytoskeleton-associated protein 5 [Plakobranchus ocellatus]|uniref:Cytoskeleton-associated protein 5 n=1 Tax=Plakobranchus ocellatus TaxID=259542 RepID=A0AAV4CNV4_9GAST|nr:cytoskeleton-associated protein 5 [Plakobranchus ocellatus]